MGKSTRAADSVIPLSKKQLEVLDLVYRGKTNKEIGKVLGVSPLTIKNHVQTILKKLKARNRQEAVYIALEKKYLEPPTRGIPAPPARNPEILTYDDAPEIIFEEGSIVIYANNTVAVNGVPVKLSVHQRRYLEFFLRYPNRIHSRQHTLDYVLSGTGRDAVEERTVDVHVRRLRQILAPAQFRIETVWGFGYRFVKRKNAPLSTVM